MGDTARGHTPASSLSAGSAAPASTRTCQGRQAAMVLQQQALLRCSARVENQAGMGEVMRTRTCTAPRPSRMNGTGTSATKPGASNHERASARRSPAE